MRSRLTIVLTAILLSLFVPRPAHAGGWAAFVAWLSKMDSGPSTGIGLEITPQCLTKDPLAARACVYPAGKDPFTPRLRLEGQLLVGDVAQQTGHSFVVSGVGIVDYARFSRLYLGAGGGWIRVAGLPSGNQDVLVLRPVRATLNLYKDLGVRVEWNWLPKGFPENAFGANTPKTGQESLLGISVVWMR